MPAANEQEEFEFRLRAEQEASPPGKENPEVAAAQRSAMIGEENAKAAREEHGPVEDVLRMAGAIPQGAGQALTGIGSAVQHPLDAAGALWDKGRSAISAAGTAIMHPLDTAGKVGESLKNMKPETVGQAIGSTAVGGVAGKAAGVLGDLVGPAAKAAVTGAPKVVNPMVDVAKKAGYTLKPSEAGGSGVAKAVEGVAGSPRLSVANSVKNQVVTNRLAGQEIGVQGKLTKATLAKAKAPHNKVYEEMKALGDIPTDAQYQADIQGIGRTPGKSFTKATNPDLEKLRSDYSESNFNASDGVLKIRELRAAANKNIKAPFDPAKNELGHAQKQIANAIEAQMERQATTLGNADLVKRFRTARQELAKIHNVEDALVGNTGDVSAKNLSKLQERGAPLSGHLKTIADVHDEFNESMRTAKKVPNKVPVTLYDALTGGARTAVRKGIQSPRFQKRLGTQIPKPYTPIKSAAPLGAALGIDQNGVGQ